MSRAFAALMAEVDYDTLTVGAIVSRAGVSRSSFYEHFTGKHDLLARSIAGPFNILADCVLPGTPPLLQPLLKHFWANRRLARPLLLGPSRQRIAAVLVREIDCNLRRHERGTRRARYRLPRRLLAWQLAESMLGLLAAWLSGEARCSTEEVARGLSSGTQALIVPWRQQP